MYPRVTLKFEKVVKCFFIVFGIILLFIFYIGVPKSDPKRKGTRNNLQANIKSERTQYASLSDVGLFLKVSIKVFKSNGSVTIVFTNTGIKTIFFDDDWFIALSVTNGKYNNFDKFHCKRENNVLDGFFITICPDVPILEGQSVSLSMQKRSVIRSNFFPNWYVADSKLNFVLLESTKDEDCNFVHFMDDVDEREERRGFESLSAEGSTLDEDVSLKILPKPLKLRKLSNDVVRLNHDDFRIVISNGLNLEAFYLSDRTGIPLFNHETDVPSSMKQIELKLLDKLDIDCKECSVRNGGYKIRVIPENEIIIIEAVTREGIMSGIQSFISINNEGQVPHVLIIDAPRYDYRGIHVDTARNFVDKEEIFKILEIMALYKMNKFIFQLADDEAWRLEVPSIPELTDYGSKRSFCNTKECEFMLPYLGSDPTDEARKLYNVADYKEILKKAESFSIEVIPLIDLPGHSKAAIKAVKKRNDIRLDDDDDASSYNSIQGYSNNVINSCLNSTWNFYSIILSTLTNLHEEIQPLKRFHIGADEVPREACSLSPACKKIGVKSCHNYGVQKIIKLAKKHNIKVQAWADAVLAISSKTVTKIPQSVKDNLLLNLWRPESHRAPLLLSKGFNLIVSNADYYYLDQPDTPYGDSWGLNWAAKYIDMKKIFRSSPAKLATCKNCSINSGKIAGIQGSVWTETIRTSHRLDEMIFPRLLAIAERGWSKPLFEDSPAEFNKEWNEFRNIVSRNELPRLEELGVEYSLPRPYVGIKNGLVEAYTEYPTLPIVYTTDKIQYKLFIQKSRLEDGIYYFSSRTFNVNERKRRYSLPRRVHISRGSITY
ncbi:DgyrCDS7482 [Dimorphilus gyrociliatus]|uniref:beta-N-acetylhexosaminidase n=1 Tax=Dimorphilus gyrociliatus TaxID=2664684 RepID=A0A7I8VW36_9ANNE|nr:DgyrCDS7482 [Dimorphilus gyrociliatus]